APASRPRPGQSQPLAPSPFPPPRLIALNENVTDLPIRTLARESLQRGTPARRQRLRSPGACGQRRVARASSGSRDDAADIARGVQPLGRRSDRRTRSNWNPIRARSPQRVLESREASAIVTSGKRGKRSCRPRTTFLLGKLL